MGWSLLAPGRQDGAVGHGFQIGNIHKNEPALELELPILMESGEV